MVSLSSKTPIWMTSLWYFSMYDLKVSPLSWTTYWSKIGSLGQGLIPWNRAQNAMVSFVKESTLPGGNFLNHVLAQSVRVVGNILHIADRDAFWISICWTKLSRWLTGSSDPEYFSAGILNLGGKLASLILLEKGAFISPRGFFRVPWCFPLFNSSSSSAILAIWSSRRLGFLPPDRAADPSLSEVSDLTATSSRLPS